MVGDDADHGINSLKHATAALVPLMRAAADGSGNTGAPLLPFLDRNVDLLLLFELLFIFLSLIVPRPTTSRDPQDVSQRPTSLPSENVSSQEEFSAEIALLVVSPWLRERRP